MQLKWIVRVCVRFLYAFICKQLFRKIVMFRKLFISPVRSMHRSIGDLIDWYDFVWFLFFNAAVAVCELVRVWSLFIFMIFSLSLSRYFAFTWRMSCHHCQLLIMTTIRRMAKGKCFAIKPTFPIEIQSISLSVSQEEKKYRYRISFTNN